jgi:hypothetical protein
MRKAYDTILQSEVSADMAAKDGGCEPYRYECACCGEEVYLAAAYSTSMVPHFRHRSGNNDVECENYLGQYGAISIDSRSRKSNRERVEFYFEKSNKTYSIGIRFSGDEINFYEQHNVVFELRSSAAEQAFFTLPINKTNFAPDFPTLIPLNKFSYCYFLSNTLNGIKRPHELFKPSNKPTFFKILGNDGQYRAKLVRGAVLYTNVPYFVAVESKYSKVSDVRFIKEIQVDDTFSFETMGRKFLGKVLSIKEKTARVDALVSSWGYQLETSETLTLLWPPAIMTDDTAVIFSDYAFLYSSFELQAHGNINLHSEDIIRVTNGVSKVSINAKTKVYRKNAEMVLIKDKLNSSVFDAITATESYANTYTIPDNNSYFLFNQSGVKPLSIGQTVFLTPKSEIKCYCFSYLISRIIPCLQGELTGEFLLVDILAHYKRTEVFESSAFSSYNLSDTASLYLNECEASGLINSVAKQFIEEGRL